MQPEAMLLVVETPIASANDIQQLRALGMVSLSL